MTQGEIPIKLDAYCKLFGLTKEAVYTRIHRNQVTAHKYCGELWFYPSETYEKIKSGRLSPSRKRRVLNKSEKEKAS